MLLKRDAGAPHFIVEHSPGALQLEAVTVATHKGLGDHVRRIIATDVGSLTPLEWARLLAASRAGLVARMTREGIPAEHVEQLLDAWDDEAYRRGLARQSPGYWDQAPEWIREQARLPRA